ncbi:MAG: divalent metal cation transporter [Opitutales bacterium]
MLRQAEIAGPGARIKTYTKLSGPGWLQSAITLGGGSLGSSLFLGVLAGYSLLWLQPVAMILGIIMLSAISHVALSTGQSPFKAINEEINPVLGWGWAIATILANVVWCLPQFALGTAAATQNLFPALNNTWGKAIVCILLLGAAIVAVLAYERGAQGAKAFDRILKVMVGLIVLAFFGVVIKMSMAGALPWGEIMTGFVPDLSLLTEPSEKYNDVLAATGEFKDFWKSKIVGMQQNVMISAAATAVGINMTFFMPFVLLGRRWGRDHRGLAKFDLWTALLIPYFLATSCVVIAAASQFNLKPVTAEEIESDAKLEKGYYELVDARVTKDIGSAEFAKLSDTDKAIQRESLSSADRNMAAMLVKRDSFNLAASLENLTGKLFSHWIFGLGVLGMALSTIIILMTINGHVVCEIMGVPHKGAPFIGGALVAGLGVLGPFFWSKASFWLVVPTSVFGFTLIPVAYLSFFLLMNNKKVLGRERPRGVARTLWNISMLAALGIMGTAAVYVAWNKKWGDLPFGKYALITFGILLVCGHFQRQISRLTKKVGVMDNKLRRPSGGGRRSGDGRGRGRRGQQQGGGRQGRPGNEGQGGKSKPDPGPDSEKSSDS